jgi:hypothetical protein
MVSEAELCVPDLRHAPGPAYGSIPHAKAIIHCFRAAARS